MPNKQHQAVSCTVIAVCSVLLAIAALTMLGSATLSRQYLQSIPAADDLTKPSNIVDKVTQSTGAHDGDNIGDGGSSLLMADLHYRVWKWCLSTTTAISALWGEEWLKIILEVVVPMVIGFVLFVVGLLWWDLWFGHTYQSRELSDQSKMGVEEESTLDSSDKEETCPESPDMDDQVSHVDSLTWSLSSPIPWSLMLIEDVNYFTNGLFGTLDPNKDNGPLVSGFIYFVGFMQVALKPFFVHSARDPRDGEGRRGDDHVSTDASESAADPDDTPGLDCAATDTASSQIQTENNAGVLRRFQDLMFRSPVESNDGARN